MLEILNHINPAQCDYEEWLTVGMAISHEGGTASDWESWSMSDTRYKLGECQRKWNSFRSTTRPCTAGSLVHIAKSQGWTPPGKHTDEALDIDNLTITADDDYRIIDTNWLNTELDILEAPENWSPGKELTEYISTLFQPDEIVGYVVETWEKDGVQLPKKGIYTRTAGELLKLLKKHKDDIGAVIGDYNQDVGVWIRFNPLDGQGVADNNVTNYKYALVESDAVEVSKQLAIIKELELPVACLVHSGNKSIHAIVKIDADSYEQYRTRVDYLYKICNKNGLDIDRQNRNPSRLSRMPGITRGNNKQYLINKNIGKNDWEEWEEWIEELNDDLPDFQPLADSFKHMPELSPVLIDGILRQGHKGLLSGPTKAGKSFDLLELAAAISSGTTWHGYQCTKGKVLYVNLEIEAASCIHRAKTIAELIGFDRFNPKNITFWHLRGRQLSMDKLAPKLIRRAMKKDFMAIIIDPIYKVITGDENSAEQMAKFFNHFDRICRDLNTALIYCHHHSKGEQGGKKSMDRSSGSGVFARDPDAVIDYIELELDDKRKQAIQNVKEVQAFTELFNKNLKNWEDDLQIDELLIGKNLFMYAQKKGLGEQARKLRVEITKKVKYLSAWKMSGNVREFAPITDTKFYFEYPLHVADNDDLLKDAKAAGEEPPWQKAQRQKQQGAQERRKAQQEEMNTAFRIIENDNEHKVVTVKLMSEHLGISETSVRNRLKKQKEYTYEHGVVTRKEETK